MATSMYNINMSSIDGIISTLEFTGIIYIIYLGIISFQDAGSFNKIFTKKSITIILQTFVALLLLTSLHEFFVLPVLLVVFIKQKKIKKNMELVLISITSIGVICLLLFGIKPNKLTSQNYYYCWNKYSLKRNLFGLDKHHYGYRVIGDHICTDRDLGINDYDYSNNEKYQNIDPGDW